MTKVNIRLRMQPRVFRTYNDGNPHILEIKADTRTGDTKIFVDGVLQESDAVVMVK